MTDATTQAAAGGTPPAALPNNFVGSATGERIAPAADPPAGAPPAAPPATPPAAATPPATPTNGGNGSRAAAPTDEPLAARLERARRKAREDVLRELGVDDPTKVKADLAELARLRTEREKADREKMTREQQLQADLEKERKTREELEAKLHEEAVARVYERQDNLIIDIARRHVDGSTKLKLDTARRAFAEYVEELPKQQVARMNERDIDRWFAKFVKDNPWLAPTTPAPAAPPPAPVRKPITTTTPAAKAKPAPPPAPPSTDPTTNPQGKTFKPGQPNSMSRAEVTAELKRRGMRGWR